MTGNDEPRDVEPEVRRLLAAGEHAAAAAALRHVGQHGRAARIFEQIFEHAAALAAWEAAGDLVAAVRVALVMKDDGAVDRLVGDAIARGLGDALLGALQKAGRMREVGRVWRARGEPALAARALEDAGALDEAAACHEDIGQTREAGLLLERWLERHPEDSAAAVRLGRILARFGRHDDAIALLQRAIRAAAPAEHDDVVVRAAPTLALAFAALGYDTAAASVLARWSAAHRRLKTAAGDDDARARLDAVDVRPPASLPELLASARAAAFAAVQRASSSPPASGSSASSSSSSLSSPSAADDAFDALLGNDVDTLRGPAAAVDAPGDVELAGQRLLLNGRYLLGEPLGGGGVGQVFRAYDAFVDRPVAVKIFGAQVLSSEAVQAWAREVRAAAAIGHPAFVRLVELNMAQGFVVTELHGEGDGAVLVEDRLQQGGPGAWLLPALEQVLDALGAAHRTGLVHGGLKPQNIFVLPGSIKLLDAGAHRLLALRSTETGGLASVWPYLAPEQLLGAPADVDGDLYAVAAIAYRALTGRPPFAGAADDRTVAPVDAHRVNDAVPPAWSTLLARALSPDRAARFTSAEELRAALPGPLTIALPRAARVDGAVVDVAATPTNAGQERWVKAGLVARHGPAAHPVKVFAARDAVVGRPVYLLEADDPSRGLLQPYVACSQLWRGVQPVYDVLFDDAGHVRAVVVAGDTRGNDDHKDDGDAFAALRAVPQGLARDLAAVAEALVALHQAGVALGGFAVARARGPIGPRLRLAPAPLLVRADADAVARDDASFDALVAVAFGLIDDPTLSVRRALLGTLHDGHLLDRADVNELAGLDAEPWARFLPRLVDKLVKGAPARVVARWVQTVLRGQTS